jgi:hypothetical protein
MNAANAIVAVRDPALAASLELALEAGAIAAILWNPEYGLEDLPLGDASTLIVEHSVLTPDPATFIAGLRQQPWFGLVILMTGDGEALSPRVGEARRVTILEMPFQAAALIAAIRAQWPDNRE